MSAPSPSTGAPVVVADVGGTNTRVALAQGASVDRATIKRFRNTAFESLEDVLRHYLAARTTGSVSGACVALAGPVRDGAAQMTNLGWHLTEAGLAEATGAAPARVALLNDLQAQGQALDGLGTDRFTLLRPGRRDRRAARLVIGLGTGVNAAPVQPMPDGRGWMVPAAEAGHIHLPLGDEQDARLGRWLRDARGYASVEDVLSGSGLERLYRFHAGADHPGPMPGLSARDILAAIDAGEPTAMATGRHYVALMARFVATLALVHLPFGGICLIGGVARAFAPHINALGFETAFCRMGRFSEFIAEFEVAVLTDDYAALSGCAAYLHRR